MDYETPQQQSIEVPVFIMLCGLPGSGKSTFAEQLVVTHSSDDVEVEKYPVIHSSDSLRKEFYGDEDTQGDNQALFSELHKRIKQDLKNGVDVIYDATNIRKKNRIAFLKEISNIPCDKVCIIMATPFEQCIENNSKRERKVPFYVIRDMQMNWCPPHKNEGFDRVIYHYPESPWAIPNPVSDSEEPLFERGYLVPGCSWDMVDSFFENAYSFDQENEHHSLTLGEHCVKAAEYIRSRAPQNAKLILTALIHDNGKLYTKTSVNKRGEEDGNCHYYQHHCVGAYNCMFYFTPESYLENDDLMDISNLIYYHMHPYNAWKQSEKALNRDKKLLGDEMYTDIMLLHEADLQAH